MSTHREKVTIIGVGGWGERIAEKLVQRGDVDVVLVDEHAQRVASVGERLGVSWSSDPYGYLMVTGTARSTVERGNVIIATPPETRYQLVNAVLQGYGLAPKRLRVEKPLAVMPDDARQIVRACDVAGVQLSVGFTLLHHALYETVFRCMDAAGVQATWVRGVRIGPRARHHADAHVDLGSHTASIAAYLGAACSIDARYCTEENTRLTDIELDTGDIVQVDELSGTISAPESWRVGVSLHDALEADLGAWLTDSHRAGARIGLSATHMVWDQLERTAVGW